MLFAFLLAAASLTPQQQSLRALADLDLRVATIGYRLARGGAGLCKSVVSEPGLVIEDLAQYAPDYRADARVALGLGDLPGVVAVVPGSAAAKAGFRPGDAIAAVDGQPVPPAPEGKTSYDRMQKLETMVEAAMAQGGATLVIRRDGQAQTIRLPAEAGCKSRFQIVPGSALQAEADGTYVQLTGALTEFAANNDELALAIAHELAHNALGHRAKLDSEKVQRGLLAAFGKNRTRIRATEVEADRYALYLMARAGYDISVAPGFWRRFGKKVDLGIFSDGTHPGGKRRAELAEQEIARIKAQEAKGEVPTP